MDWHDIVARIMAFFPLGFLIYACWRADKEREARESIPTWYDEILAKSAKAARRAEARRQRALAAVHEGQDASVPAARKSNTRSRGKSRAGKVKVLHNGRGKA